MTSEDLDNIIEDDGVEGILSDVDDSSKVAFSSANPSTYTSEQVVEMYKQVQDFLEREYGFQPESVFEPSNGLDISASQVFEDPEVIYVNPGKETVGKLEEEDCRVVQTSPNEINLDFEPDLSIFRNTVFDESDVLRTNPSDYVMANNHTDAAQNVHRREDYTLIGIVDQESREFEKQSHVSDVSLDGQLFDDNLYVFRNE